MSGIVPSLRSIAGKVGSGKCTYKDIALCAGLVLGYRNLVPNFYRVIFTD